MIDSDALASEISDAASPTDRIPEPLPVPPLDLLVALHAVVAGAMRSDLARAGRAAAAARAIAARFPDDALIQAQAHWSLGSAILYVPRYADSLAHYDLAMEWYAHALDLAAPAEPQPDIRVVEVVRVFCLNELGRYREAINAAARAEGWLSERPAPHVRLTLLLNRSLLAGNMGNYAGMLALADETIRLAEHLDNSSYVAMGWINRAYACIWLGQLAEAETALDVGEATAEAAGEALTIARAQINRAWLLRYTGRLFDALAMLQAAERGMAQAEGEVATIALEQAALYAQLRQLREARRAAERAAALFDGENMPLYSASAYVQAARMAVDLCRLDDAQQMLTQARRRAAGLDLPALDAEIISAEARAALLPPSPGAARLSRQAARRAVARAADILESAGLPREAAEASLAGAALDARMGHVRRARAAYAAILAIARDSETRMAAHTGMGTLLPPRQALPHLRTAADLAVQQRRALPMEELQARYSSETSGQHMALARCLLDLGDTPAALHTVWEAKAGPLLDLRAAAAPLDQAAMDAVTAAKADLARGRASVAEHQRKLLEALQMGQPEQVAYHRAEADRARRAVDSVEQQMTEMMRTLSDRVGQADLPTMSAVQAALLPGTLLLEYARIDDSFVCLLLRQDGPPTYWPVADRATVTTLLSRWAVVSHGDPNDRYPLETASRRQQVLTGLATALLGPLAAEIAQAESLLIAPADTLAHVPWAALISASPTLGDHLQITLTPSGAFWAAPFTPPPAAGPPRVLGYPGVGEHFLPHVLVETDMVALALPGALRIPSATGADLRAGPPPRMLHIACHGVTRPNAPICSYLDLADGPFLLLEAHRLNLRGTGLVVLSACETGERPGYGEMAMALAGAFLCAGARAVLASLWAVDDRAAADLMAAFYARLAAGDPPAIALRAAQQAVRTAHPHHWAAFQIWEGVRTES
ncbi:CHAT domain-containing protein [Chloroflexales bacterium ZM16-3]|nr:CHAT domain-containing protein [Chloroflexales bacterium ZM16-3]